MKRDLVLGIDPELYPEIEGSTDSEVFFHLALTLGLEQDPPAAVERAVGVIEEVGRQHGVEHPIQMTVATTDGERVFAFRYSSEGRSRSLFFSTDLRRLRTLHPTNPLLDGARGREQAGGVRAARRPERRLERGARVQLGGHPAGTGRAAPLPASPPAASTLL